MYISKNIFKSDISRDLILLFIVNIAVVFCVFSLSGVYNDGVDTTIYVSQINSFSNYPDILSQDESTLFRLSKPLYGIVGAVLSTVFDPYTSILIINLAFLLGLTFATYLFIKRLGFDPPFPFAGAVWVAAAYPMFKYGIALGTDISGWFFATATIAIFLHASHRNNIKYVLLATLVGFVGSLSKETGVLGLIFCGFYILMQYRFWDNKKIFSWLAMLCVPFFVLQSIFQYVLHKYGAPSFLDWYSFNQDTFSENYYKLHYFLGVEASTFHIILLFALIGLVFAIRNKDFMRRAWLSIYVPLLIAVLPVLLWPIFISRVLFIQFLFFVPLALYGLSHLHTRYRYKKVMGIPVALYLLVLPPLLSFVLFFMSGKGSLFDVVRSIFTL